MAEIQDDDGPNEYESVGKDNCLDIYDLKPEIKELQITGTKSCEVLEMPSVKLAAVLAGFMVR